MSHAYRTPLRCVGYFLRNWLLPRQARGANDKGAAVRSTLSESMRPRLEEADRIGASVCPSCAVGCSPPFYARNERLIHVEGNPESPRRIEGRADRDRLEAANALVSLANGAGFPLTGLHLRRFEQTRKGMKALIEDG